MSSRGWTVGRFIYPKVVRILPYQSLSVVLKGGGGGGGGGGGHHDFFCETWFQDSS